jgi:hypothetical protein
MLRNTVDERGRRINTNLTAKSECVVQFILDANKGTFCYGHVQRLVLFVYRTPFCQGIHIKAWEIRRDH